MGNQGRPISRGGGGARFRAFDVLLIVGALASMLIAGLAMAARRVETNPHPRLTLQPVQVDLGQVDQREKVPFAFTIKNETDAAVEVTEVFKPCTCTDVGLPVGTEIGPRSQVEVAGGLNTVGKRGPSRTTLLISYKPVVVSAEAPDAKLSLDVPLYVDVRPAIEVPREPVRLRADEWTTVELKAGAEPTFEVRGIAASDSFIKHEVADGSLNVPTSAFAARFKLDASRVDPAISLDGGDFWIQFATSAAGDPTITLPVSLDLPAQAGPKAP